MFRYNSRPVLLGILLAAAASAPAQKFQPKTIQFIGDPEYTNAELMKAAGLKLGDILSAAEMNQYSQKLMDSGVFAGLVYKFDGQDLIFQIRPAQLFPLRLENLPLTPGPELDARLRAQLPLYHGTVPAEGGLLTDVCTALQDQLKALGIAATVGAVPYTDLTAHKVTAMSFSISTPAMLVGDIQIQGAGSVPDQARQLLSKVAGSAYDREGSARAIVQSLEQTYRDEGYLDAAIHLEQLSSFAVSEAAVRVPFRVSVDAGSLYRVTAIQLVPGLLVSQADFDKQANTHPGDPADAVHIRQNWQFIERQYHNHGYMKAHVRATPTLNRAQSTVSYEINVDPGPVYTMGTLTIQNVSDDLRTAMLAAWKMPAGGTFNEGAILGFFATYNVNPKLERIFAVVNCKYVLHLNDETRTVDVVLRLERRS